jgi:hypothetical protein
MIFISPIVSERNARACRRQELTHDFTFSCGTPARRSSEPIAFLTPPPAFVDFEILAERLGCEKTLGCGPWSPVQWLAFSKSAGVEFIDENGGGAVYGKKGEAGELGKNRVFARSIFENEANIFWQEQSVSPVVRS